MGTGTTWSWHRYVRCWDCGRSPREPATRTGPATWTRFSGPVTSEPGDGVEEQHGPSAGGGVNTQTLSSAGTAMMFAAQLQVGGQSGGVPAHRQRETPPRRWPCAVEAVHDSGELTRATC